MRYTQRITEYVKSLKLRQRMIWVYVLGCFLPFLLCYLYMYHASQKSMVVQRIQSENEKNEIEADMIEQSMDLAVELSTRLYFEDQSGTLVMTQYFGENNLKVDYRNYEEFSEYVNDYYRDISSVVVYLNPEVIKERHLIDNRHFKLVTEFSRDREWYKNTENAGGNPRWSFWTNTQTGKVSLRMSRVLYDEKASAVGVVSIALAPEITGNYIDAQEYYSLLVLNDKDIVQSNVKISDDELSALMNKIHTKNFNGWIDFRGERSVVTATKIAQRYSQEDIYYLISIKPYMEVLAFASRNVIISLLPMLIGSTIMIIATVLLSRWFNSRITSLSRAMHRVAEGDRDVSDTLIGEAQDEIYDLYTDLNHMIQEMQLLAENAANERIQKEQLYSRQKDVEFKMLATQINPHFLYNTLENIRMLGAMNHIREIEDISVNLTKILRASLSVGQGLKTLKWEMDIIKCYIAIQNFRFDDRITATIDYDENIGEKYMVIPFVVQPFVENAYVHALEDVDEDGQIVIRVSLDEEKGELCIAVEDNGCGMNEEKLAEMMKYLNDFDNLDRTHIGICNVNQRIKLRFGVDYGVDFDSRENVGTRVEIHLPLIESEQ